MFEIYYNQTTDILFHKNNYLKKKNNFEILIDKDHWYLEPIKYSKLKKTKFHSPNYLERCDICYFYINKNNLSDWYLFICKHKTCIKCYQNIINSFDVIQCPFCRAYDINQINPNPNINTNNYNNNNHNINPNINTNYQSNQNNRNINLNRNMLIIRFLNFFKRFILFTFLITFIFTLIVFVLFFYFSFVKILLIPFIKTINTLL